MLSTTVRSSLLGLILALASRSFAATAGDGSYGATCKAIAAAISPASAVNYPGMRGSAEYAQDIFHAYSSSSTNATCSVEPGSKQDLANILQIISEHRTPYAVKSGGHATNPGWSSSPGIQIAMSRFNSTSYNAATNVATVNTGQRWEQVYPVLEPFNVSVAGGRVSGLGVGGFTLGGGYSWLTNQVGLSIDTVVAFEVVTPTGQILTATNTSYSDLFFGLKGGGNNFGVVTAIHYTAVHQPAVWGGLNVVSGAANITKLSQAISDFDANNTDPKAALGVTYGYNPSLGGLFLSVFFYYHGPTPPAGTFDALLAVPTVSSSVSTTTLSHLVGGFVGPEVAPRALWRSVSITNYTVPVLQQITDQLQKNGPIAFNHSASQFTFAVEPLLRTIFDHQPNGPAALVHKPGSFFAPSVVVMSWADPSQDQFFFNLLKNIDFSVRDFAASAKGGFQPVEPPTGFLYPNYASYDTPTSLFFGDNLPKLRAIQMKYDPKNVTGLTKGWKFY